MKKQLFLMAIMAAAISLASCEKPVGPDKPDDPGKDTTTVDPGKDTTTVDVKVIVAPHEVVLTAEEPSVRLAATLDPADPTATIVWSSSDTLVATVTSRGYVEATGYGDCYIYASVGNAKDSCHVMVKSYLESLIFNNAVIWSVDTTVAKDPKTGEYKVDTVEASDGSVWNCYFAEALLRVFSDGFYVNNSGYIDGTEQGAIIDIHAPVYYGTNYLNPENGGVIFSLGQWGVFEGAEGRAHACEPAKFDETEYINQMKSFIDEFNSGGSSYGQYLKAAGEAVSGPVVNVWEYDAEGEGYYYSYIPDALVEEALLNIGAASSVSQYMRELDYCTVTYKPFAYDNVFGLNCGLNLDYDEATEQVTLLEEKVYFNESITSVYGEVPSSEAPKMTPVHMPIISENPALKASLEKQIKDKNIRVIRVK